MIESIWIEIRPALNCCHFCIVLKENVHSEVKMKVKKSGLVFDVNRDVFYVNFKEFTVEPLTMTSFKMTSQYLSFRIQSECDFKFDKRAPPKLVPPAFRKAKTSLLCQCHNSLTKEIAFERILPLPSTQFSFSDMFCHFPPGLGPPSTSPRPNDCFYSDDCLVVNEENITNCLRKGKFWKCKRCLATVGTRDKNSVKFYLTCIKLPYDDSTLLEHLKGLIHNAISGPVSLFPKILLECEENGTFLSLVVVDKNLVVSTCEENLLLKNSEVVKLKFKFHSSCDSDVKLLKEDLFHSLHHVQVHKSMLDYSTKYLISCSKTIPSIFGRVDNECMAYLNL